MPALTVQELNYLRANRHSCEIAVDVYNPRRIWTAQVSGTPAPYATTFAVTAPTVVVTPTADMKVLFGAATGDDSLGQGRFKSYSAPNLTIADNNVTLTDGDWITILEEIKPEAKHVYINDSDVVSEDGTIAYTDQSLKIDPVARCGTHVVGYRSPSTGIATLRFYSNSAALAEGATLASCLWVLPFGTFTTGNATTFGTAGVPNVVTWTELGTHYGSFTVTDSNGKTHTRYFVICIRDLVNDLISYHDVELDPIEGDVDTGIWNTTIRVHTNAETDHIINQALVIVHARDWYGGNLNSIGNELYRENIVFSGYIRKGSIRRDAMHGYVEFDVESLTAVMDNIWEYGGGLETTTGTPTGWHQIHDMTYNLACWHVLHHHSTISSIADCYLNLPTYTIEYVDLPDGPIREELDQAAKAVRGRIACTKGGSLYLEINPQLQSFASRSATYVLDTDRTDMRGELDFGEERQEKEFGQIDFEGENAVADPLFSLAPQKPWPHGKTERVDGIRVTDQTEANEFAGLFEGYRNNDFGEIVIPWRGNYRCFDIAPSEPISLNLTAALDPRGYAWTGVRCWTRRVVMEYTPGIMLVTTTVERDAYGPPGATNTIIPPEPPKPRPPTEPPEKPLPPEGCVGIECTPGKGNLLYISTLKGILKCEEAYGTTGLNGTPVWTAVNTGLNTAAKKRVRFFNLDPFSSNGDHFTAAWAYTDDYLYRCTGLPDAGTWTQVLSRATAAGLIGQAEGDTVISPYFGLSVQAAGTCMVMVGYYAYSNLGQDYWYWYPVWTTNYGATWQTNTGIYSVHELGAGGWWSPHVICSPHVAGRWYVYAGCAGTQATDPTPHPRAWVHRMTTTTLVPDTSWPVDHYIHCAGFVIPWANNAAVPYTNDQRAYAFKMEYGGNADAIRRYASFGNPVWAADYAPPAVTGVGAAGMAGSGADPRVLEFNVNMWNEDHAGALETSKIWMSGDGGSNWTDYGTPTVGARTFTAVSFFAVPADPHLWFFSGAGSANGEGMVVLTTQLGANWRDISYTAPNNLIDVALGAALVPGDMANTNILIDYFHV